MMSWAVTRGPSLVPGDKRLAVHVEDHPIEYDEFEGTIPKGEYGGGTVMIWDRGTWTPEHDPHRGCRRATLISTLHGEKLKGRWHLVRMRKRPGERQEPWLLIKANDEHAARQIRPGHPGREPRSAASGRAMDEIASRQETHLAFQPKREGDSRRPPKQRKTARRQGRRASAEPRQKRSARAKSDAARQSDEPMSRARRRRGCPTSSRRAWRRCRARRRTGDWVHEIKFDGYRMQARHRRRQGHAADAQGLDWTAKFPPVAARCAALAGQPRPSSTAKSSVDEDGIVDFSALQDDLKNGRQRPAGLLRVRPALSRRRRPAGAPLVARKARSRSCSPAAEERRHALSEHFEADGATMLEHACSSASKASFRSGATRPIAPAAATTGSRPNARAARSSSSLGYEPSDARSALIGALVLGYYENGKLHYAGRVGTGWSQKSARDLRSSLQRARRDTAPLGQCRRRSAARKVKWVEPQTRGRGRVPRLDRGRACPPGVVQGLREDKSAQQVVREIEPMPDKVKQAALRQKRRQAKPRRQSRASPAAAVRLPA